VRLGILLSFGPSHPDAAGKAVCGASSTPNCPVESIYFNPGGKEMAVQIVAPKLGMSMSDVTMVEWKVKEGQKVEKGTVVFVIETEKTEWNVEAGASGFHILVEEGEG
jgi:biotin carboxyl carrier protein